MEVTSYLKTFFRGKNTALMAKMLIQPLSLDLVHALAGVLERHLGTRN